LRIFSLDDSAVESAQTLFFDGILSGEMFSIKEAVLPSDIPQLVTDFHYFDFSTQLPSRDIEWSEKSLIIDFGANSVSEINQKIASLSALLGAFSIFDIIAACCYYPALLLHQTAELTKNRCTKLVLWEGVDLIHKKCTESTCIRVL
jgi:hypothetical protein